jgi:hypothetical protein
VSKRAQANEQAQSNAPAQSRAERSADPAAFKAKYGTGSSKANAFGKCVSGKVKHSK